MGKETMSTMSTSWMSIRDPSTTTTRVVGRQWSTVVGGSLGFVSILGVLVGVIDIFDIGQLLPL